MSEQYTKQEAQALKRRIDAIVMAAPLPKMTRTPNAKLTPEKVRQIRQFSDCGVSHRQLSKWFGVTTNSIANVLSGRTWGHVI
jgi:hypothetical protein